MKIALISRRYPPLIGGAEKVFSYLARALAAEGADVTALTARPLDRETPETEAWTPAKGEGRLRVVRLGTSPIRFVGTLIYMRNLRRWLTANPVDLAYVSMLKHDAYVAIGVGAKRGFPVVLRPEGAGATGDVAWQAWGRFGPTIAKRCKRAEAIVSIAPAITEELKKAGYDPSRIHALANGVPVPAQPWKRRNAWREAPRAVFVGRLAKEKGLDVLLEAWPMVLGLFPRARLTLIGEGPERPALEAQVARLGLNGAVEMPGALDDPSSALRDSDLFVLPSREEGMSIALLEALAIGVPTVATSIPGNRRLIQDYQHARLFPPDDSERLARVILDQWTNFDRAFQMTRAARRRVQEDYSIEAMAKRHMELFRKLIDDKQETSSQPPAPC